MVKNDGYQIAMLIMLFLNTFYPELVRAGKVYCPILPLYEGEKNNKKVFLFSEEEKQQSTGIKNLGYLKGLGELETEDLQFFLTDTKTRQLSQVQFETEDEYEEFCENLKLAFSKNRKEANERKQMFM